MLTYFPFQNGRQISCKMAQCVYIKIRGFARGTCAQPQLGPWLRIFETKCALRRGIDFVDKFPSLPREIVPPSQGLILKLQYFIKKNIFFKYLHDPIENLYVTIPRKSQKIIKHMFTAHAKMLNPIYIYIKFLHKIKHRRQLWQKKKGFLSITCKWYEDRTTQTHIFKAKKNKILCTVTFYSLRSVLKADKKNRHLQLKIIILLVIKMKDYWLVTNRLSSIQYMTT